MLNSIRSGIKLRSMMPSGHVLENPRKVNLSIHVLIAANEIPSHNSGESLLKDLREEGEKG